MNNLGEIDPRVRYALNVKTQRERTRRETVTGCAMLVIGTILVLTFGYWFLTWDGVNLSKSWMPLACGVGIPIGVSLFAAGCVKVSSAA